MTERADDHRRDRPLTVLVMLEAIELFVVAPLSAKRTLPAEAIVFVGFCILAAVIVVVWRSKIAVLAVVLAAVLEISATVLRFYHPSSGTEFLDFCAGFTLLVALTVVLGFAVFGPGRVTIHRVVGAIAIYLNVAAAFALGYRVINAAVPQAFAPQSATVAHGHALSTLVYFSFTTLTTTGFGDIVPVDPLARSLASLEGVIGQLFPATLLARLITLELEARRG